METKKVKVVMLPTKDEGVIMTDVGVYDNAMVTISSLSEKLRGHDRPHQHLYFTSDEDIKEGDWCIDIEVDRVFKAKFDNQHNYTKIIASTDPKLSKLIAGGGEGNAGIWEIYPQIPQSFIEEYCKQGGVDEVELEYEWEEGNKFELDNLDSASI